MNNQSASPVKGRKSVTVLGKSSSNKVIGHKPSYRQRKTVVGGLNTLNRSTAKKAKVEGLIAVDRVSMSSSQLGSSRNHEEIKFNSSFQKKNQAVLPKYSESRNSFDRSA